MIALSTRVWDDLLTALELDLDATAALLEAPPAGPERRTLRRVPPPLDGLLPPLASMPPVPGEFAPRVEALAQRAADLQLSVQAALERMRTAPGPRPGTGPHMLDVAG